MTRKLRIRYGPALIGGTSTSHLLDGFTKHVVADGTSLSSIDFECVVRATTEDALKAHCDALERTFRTPRLALGVTQEGRSLLRVDHDSAGGGFNTNPEIVKAGQIGDSGRSRRYRLRVTFETPADQVTTSGLRESTVNVSYDESRIRTIRVSGTFTAVEGTTSARARYEAAIAAHATSVMSALSVTNYNLEDEPVTEHDYDDKVLRFERVYREIIFGEGQDDPNDDPDITRQSLSVSRRDFSEEYAHTVGAGQAEVDTGGLTGGVDPAEVVFSGVQALSVFDLRYDASIDATRTTDLRAKYSSLREWLLSQFSSFFSQGRFALTVERPTYDRVSNRISVEMVAEGPVQGVGIVSRRQTTEQRKIEPHVFRGAWTGDPYDHYRYQGHAIHTKTRTTVSRVLARESDEDPIALAGGGGLGSDWTVIESSSTTDPVRIGIHGSGKVIDMTDVTTVVTGRKINEVSVRGGDRGRGGIEPGPGGGFAGV